MNAIPIALQFVDGLNDERGVEVSTTHTGSGWGDADFRF